MYLIYRLVIAARTSAKLEETVSLCHTHVYSVIADVGKEQDCKNIIDVAVEKLGGVDILILNAAYSYPPNWFSEIDSPVSNVLIIMIGLL